MSPAATDGSAAPRPADVVPGITPSGGPLPLGRPAWVTAAAVTQVHEDTAN